MEKETIRRKRFMYESNEIGFSVGGNGFKIKRTKPVEVSESVRTTKNGKTTRVRSYRRRKPRTRSD
jgi:hypothetical protein